jgi:alpha-beta hydrolase superfamily lysophospholipase
VIKQDLKINGIPAILWGGKAPKLFIAVHGNMSSKSDDVIVILAEKATQSGYQVLSFDLPEHGERRNDPTPCKVQYCVKDLSAIIGYAKTKWDEISLFACSMGAYFSLLTYKEEALKQCIFLSPVVDMERIINNMMTWFSVSKEQLKAEKEVATPIGQILYWDYYCYVKDHPISSWNKPTAILYGSDDDLCECEMVSNFAQQFNCDLTVMEYGEHYFHTKEQLEFFGGWVAAQITGDKRPN